MVNRSDQDPKTPQINSLQDLLDYVTGKNLDNHIDYSNQSTVADIISYPFLAIVGQKEMKIALLLALINPHIGGVLLIGPRGTGKTTAVRSLTDILPGVVRSKCYYGCTEEDIQSGGMDAVCPDCAKKFAEGEALTHQDSVRLIELPLNATLDDVIGSIDHKENVHPRKRIKKGILTQADQNILYIDEVNMLSDAIMESILDASSNASYKIYRGSFAASYRTRFTLIGSMNPEEGNLRPQLMDRFGLRVLVQGPDTIEQRLEIYKRVVEHKTMPYNMASLYSNDGMKAVKEIESARKLLPSVVIPDEIAKIGIDLINELKIHSLRAEVALFESARALAATNQREQVTIEDLVFCAPLALRLRSSEFINDYFENCSKETNQIQKIFNHLVDKQSD